MKTVIIFLVEWMERSRGNPHPAAGVHIYGTQRRGSDVADHGVRR
jgi:hypothetical protein